MISIHCSAFFNCVFCTLCHVVYCTRRSFPNAERIPRHLQRRSCHSFPLGTIPPMETQNSPPRFANPQSPSSSASREPKLHLPSTTNPPGPQNPPKPLVWLVRLLAIYTQQPYAEAKRKFRYSARPATWAAHLSKTPLTVTTSSPPSAAPSKTPPKAWPPSKPSTKTASDSSATCVPARP